MNQTFSSPNNSLCCIHLSPYVTLPTKCFCCLVLFLTIVTNSFLLIILRRFSSLRTPPNNYLLNISINNFTLCICMTMSIIYLLTASPLKCSKILIFYKLQLFVSSNAFLQYWGTFVSIGFYRYWTLRQQCLSQKMKMRIITQSVSACWIVSTSLSGLLIWTFTETEHMYLALLFCLDKSNAMINLTADQSIVLSLYLLILFLGFTIIILSYYRTFKALSSIKFPPKCKVTPFNMLDCHMTNPMDPCQQTNSVDFLSKYTFMVSTQEPYSSPSLAQESSIVYYSLKENSLLSDGVFALENPIKASRLERSPKPEVNRERSIGTTDLEKEHVRFTDITSESNIKRMQTQQWRQVIRKLFFQRDDRLSLKTTTRNSFFMLLIFLVLSFPFFLCNVPGFLIHTFSDHSKRLIVMIISQLLFYVNGPIYPVYYFVFCKQIRKSFFTLIDLTLFHLKIRKQ